MRPHVESQLQACINDTLAETTRLHSRINDTLADATTHGSQADAAAACDRRTPAAGPTAAAAPYGEARSLLNTGTPPIVSDQIDNGLDRFSAQQ